ncbi:MAG: alpha/beta hydrolase [Candidatus Gracilibacteria bacterium]|jgi:hypothetical protein
MDFFIFHGTGGYPEENFFPWLKVELEKLGHNVTVPQLPDADKPDFDKWFNFLEKYEKDFGPDMVLIGHSLGGAVLLRELEKIPNKVKATFIIAAPIGVSVTKYYETDKPFIAHPFDWAKIKNSAEKFVVFHSDNDPFVQLINGQELAKNLGIDLMFVPNAGHFNTASGYTKFELLLQKIKEII